MVRRPMMVPPKNSIAFSYGFIILFKYKQKFDILVSNVSDAQNVLYKLNLNFISDYRRRIQTLSQDFKTHLDLFILSFSWIYLDYCILIFNFLRR